MAEPRRQLLADLAAAGEPVPCAGNLPLDLGDPGFVWFVEEGAVDVFLFEQAAEVEQSAPQHLLRAEAGRLLPGVAPQGGETTLRLIAKGLSGTVLRRLSIADLEPSRPEELAALLDAWIMDVSATLAKGIMQRPSPDAYVESGQPPAADARSLSTRRGVSWVRMPAAAPGNGLFMDLIETGAGEAAAGGVAEWVPLTQASWLTLAQPGGATEALSSEDLATRGELLSALNQFHRIALDLQRINRSLLIVDQANLERAASTSRRIDEHVARRRLFDLGGIPGWGEEDGDRSALAEALRVVGRHEKIDFDLTTKTNVSEFVPDLDYILDASGVRARQVRLSSGKQWWLGDSGAMLAFRADDGRPVALLPGTPGRYRLVDPAAGRAVKVTAEQAASLNDNAWVFYRPLEPIAIRPLHLLRAAGRELAAGFARFSALGLLSGLIALLPALMLGFVVDRITPNIAFGALYAVTAVLVLSAALWVLMQTLQGMALMRLEAGLSSKFEAALWDRLLRLPPGFLNRYPAGDRAMRGMTFFHRLRDVVQGVVMTDVLSILSVIPALVVIFLLNTALGFAAAAFGALALFATVALALWQLSPHARTVRAVQDSSGLLFQMVNGISKLRVEGAEGSAFAAWARVYTEQQRAELNIGDWRAHLFALGAALPLIATAVVLAVAATQVLSTGTFLTIYAAFMLCVMGLIRFGASIGEVLTVIPEFNRIRPFLDAVPETSSGGEPVWSLGGDIVFDHVSFRYDPDGPLVLDDVSIHARPGEFIAIAGESGSGKSTLFQLALGLHQPTAGAVYYDERDLRQLNLKQLRRKIGAVPQDVRLNPLDLWDNIVGDGECEDAGAVWEAVRSAGIDQEIDAMPMKMLTYVGGSQSVISGGEAQRIIIARALLRKPRVLFLDEATNWLDNENQAKIMNELASLASTRIVIAHRLSTLRKADRIYVMRAGRIIERGSYAELIEAGGFFLDLVRRQET